MYWYESFKSGSPRLMTLSLYIGHFKLMSEFDLGKLCISNLLITICRSDRMLNPLGTTGVYTRHTPPAKEKYHWLGIGVCELGAKYGFRRGISPFLFGNWLPQRMCPKLVFVCEIHIIFGKIRKQLYSLVEESLQIAKHISSFNWTIHSTDLIPNNFISKMRINKICTKP